MRQHSQTPWWGDFDLDERERVQWQVGPLRLWAERSAGEWRLWVATEGEPGGSDATVSIPANETPESADADEQRFGFEQAPSKIRITPRLADRATVVYPESAFHVTPGQGIHLFCSTPIWIAVEVGDEPIALLDVPTFRPPDTWFGPSTIEGELCYATRTAARLRREDLPSRPHRAVTELHLVNHASSLLPLERVNLSVPFLTLYSTPHGTFWTDAVTLTRGAEGSLGELNLGGAPAGMELEPVSSPRKTAKAGNVMVRAFSAIFD